MDQKSNRSLIGAVFGLIFVISGIAAAYGSAGKMVFGFVSSIGWQEVPATIHHVALVSKHGDTTTYSVESQYSYTYNGVRYKNDRVSLSTGSDNIGRYWQDLERSIRASQSRNEASAIVNPKDPTHALLDRSIRWSVVVFGLVFLVVFGGFGGFCMWASLRGSKSAEARKLHEQDHGITSNQKTGSWFLAAFGGVFFLMGTGLSLVVLPDAIREGQYGALFILLFAVVGAGMIYHAFKVFRAYQRFGPTPLHLDPSAPGVGGQLGGQLTLVLPDTSLTAGTATELLARLTCTRKSKSGDSTSRSIKWQEEAPVYLKRTASGIEASFLFEIPDSCTPTKEWNRGSSFDWRVTVHGEFNEPGLGKFERSWVVVVEEGAAQASNILSIPQSFLQKAKQTSEARAKASAINQVPVTEDAQYINVHSRAGRDLTGKMFLMLFGAVFSAAGIFTIMQSWWPGYIFLLIGTAIFLSSLYILGKSIEVKINKDSWVLYTRESWCKVVYAHRQGDVVDPDQFRIRKTSSSSNGDKLTEYYAVYFESCGKTIRIADGIEGKKEAVALKDAIIECCFSDEQLAIAA